MTVGSIRLPLRERLLLAGATGWSALLIPLAFLMPVESARYSPINSGANQSRAMESLVTINGRRILLVVVIPLLVSLIILGLLIMRQQFRWAAAGWLAWILSIGLLAAAVLGMVTFLIGVYVLPSGALLVACCGSLRGRRQMGRPTNGSETPLLAPPGPRGIASPDGGRVRG
jgi:hypothetical protein